MFAIMENDVFSSGEQFPGQRAALEHERRESARLRRQAKSEHAAAAAMRQAFANAVEQERIVTRQSRRLATRAKNAKQAFRTKSLRLRRQLRLERLLHMALR